MLSKQTTYNHLEQLLHRFKAIGLPEMDSVKLQNRTERKFVMHISRLEEVMQIAMEEYRALEIDGTRLLDYNTEYFDTSDNAMYLAHHNSKQNRFKVRKREYLISGEQFLEVKKRLNNGRTLKKRVELPGNNTDHNFGRGFIEAVTPYQLDHLEKKLDNSFRRITLVHNVLKERITIDLELSFSNKFNSIRLPSVVIIEIKREKAGDEPGFERIMKDLRIQPSSVSKYCIGRAMLEPSLKANLFQNKIRYFTKLNAILHDCSINDQSATL